MFLKQSTAVVIQFGPLVDPTDAVTAKTGLVSAIDHASTGILLSKNGGTRTIRHATVTASTHDSDGYYKVTLDTTDTNTLGHLRVAWSSAANCLPYYRDFLVLAANVYDSLVAASVYLKTDLTQVLTVAGVPTKLSAQANVTTIGTVNTAINAPDVTHASFSDITEATTSHYVGKSAQVLTGALAGQRLGVVTASVLTTGENVMTFSRGSPSGETLANGDTVEFT
jgi:hypothetical protein